MKINIDESILKDTKSANGTTLSLAEFLVSMVVKLGHDPKEITDNLIEKQVIIWDETKESYLIYNSFAKLIKKVLLESDENIPRVNTLEDLAEALRNMFPEGSKPDRNGKPMYSWKGNKIDVATKLQKFFKIYGTSYTYEEIIEATRIYLSKYEQDGTYRMILPYFIHKQDKGSQLATEIELLRAGEVPNNEPKYSDGELMTL